MSTPLPAPVDRGPFRRARVTGLADRAARAFAPQACLLGYAVFTKGGVSLEAVDERRARLVVKGKRARTVDVHVVSGALRVTCTCAPSTLPLAPCRHLWAGLLELDRREAFADLRATRGPLRIDVEAPAPAPPAGEAQPSPAHKGEKDKSEKAKKTAKAPKPSAKPERARRTKRAA